jgi:3-phenylpropionate/trans-cinnamate dioxygenase ferredoxin component
MTEVSLGRLADFEIGVGRRFDVADEQIAVFRTDAGVYAIADRCSHAEASLSEGELFGTEVECPRHGAEFDITSGKPMSLPATKPVRTYPVTIEDGDVLVGIEGGGHDG